MSRSRRKNWNTVNAPSLARWIVLTGFLGLTGLVYVYLTIQLHQQGDRKKALERELARLHSQSQDAGAQIEALTSQFALQRRLTEGSLQLISITQDHIVKLTPRPRLRGANAVQPVANPRPER